MTSVTSFILNKEKRFAFSKIKMLGINENGIIYGGMVRDEIIATHYKSKFDEYYGDGPEIKYSKFWDTSYHPETCKRALVPNDMDIYFHNNSSAQEFITKLSRYIANHYGTMFITNGLLYGVDENYTHKKVNIHLKIGRSICNPGIKLKLEIDLIINNNELNTVEPPFNNADFTCNLFVMSKIEHNKYEIRLSRNTGTKLDTISIVDKSKFQSKILTDLINEKTEFIRNIESPDTEYFNGMRILKMLNHPYIKITNLLFKEIQKTPELEDCICDICQISVKETNTTETSQQLVKILTNKHAHNIMHKDCFKNYLQSEVSKKYVNRTTEQIECKCTRRNLFNFKNSYKFSSLYV
jgi:hypothetical protein